MKVFQIPFCFYPEPVGGTEIYVEALTRHLQSRGHESVIVAPGAKNETYHYRGLAVHRFSIASEVVDLDNLYGKGDEIATQNFSAILDAERPDLVHLHAFTSAVSIQLLRAAHQRQIPVIFTYHTPTVSCQRGTLLENGKQLCSGKIDVAKCTSCTLQGIGLPEWSSWCLGKMPPSIGQSVGSLGLQGGIWTVLRMTALLTSRQDVFNQLMSESEHIVAVCDWVKAVLVENAIAHEKITVLRQGLCHPTKPMQPDMQKPVDASLLRLVFLGRLDPTKGLHILLEAIKVIDNQHITLDIYGVSQSGNDSAYQKRIEMLVRDDPRVRLLAPIRSENVVSTIATYDLLVVPSQWLETGPMVVLEAFAAGVPVLGSNLGGISELVQDEITGILVEPDSLSSWVEKLEDLVQNQSRLKKLRRNILPPTNMKIVAEKMEKIYATILSTPLIPLFRS